jgi:hypothetical protein
MDDTTKQDDMSPSKTNSPIGKQTRKSKLDTPKYNYECTYQNSSFQLQLFPDSHEYIRLFFSRRMHIYISKESIELIQSFNVHTEQVVKIQIQFKENNQFIVLEKEDVNIEKYIEEKKNIVKKAMKNTRDLLGFDQLKLQQVEFVVTNVTWQNMHKFRDQMALWNVISDVPILYQLTPSQFSTRNARDATRSMCGYLHQLDVALYYWLTIGVDPECHNQCILVEFGEDVAMIPLNMVDQAMRFQQGKNWTLDINNEAYNNGKIILDQVKLVKEKMNFKSKSIGDLFCQCFLTKKKLPDGLSLYYNFTTSSTVEHSKDWNDSTEENTSSKIFKDLQPSYAGYSDNDWNAFTKTSFKEYKGIVSFDPGVTPDGLKVNVIKLIKQICGKEEKDFCESVRHCLYGYMKDRIIEYRESKLLKDKMFTYQMLMDQLELLKNPMNLLSAMKQRIEELENDLEQEVQRREEIEQRLGNTLDDNDSN